MLTNFYERLSSTELLKIPEEKMGQLDLILDILMQSDVCEKPTDADMEKQVKSRG